MNSLPSHWGRELARLIATLNDTRDPQLRGRTAIIDHAFVCNRDRQSIIEALKPLCMSTGYTRGEDLAMILLRIPSLSDDDFDTLCWEYRDERVELLHAQR